MLRRDGTCTSATCPNYDKLDETAGLTAKKCVVGETCLTDANTPKPLLGRDGVCAATCPVYDLTDDTNKKCVEVSCVGEATNTILTRTGTCVSVCPDYDEKESVTSPSTRD